MNCARFLLCLFWFSLVAPAQPFVHIPDDLANQGICNTIPFGTAYQSIGYTYLARIPASSLNPTRPRIMDVAFAPCAAGTWESGDVFIAIGHIAPNQPCPFNFPMPGTLGDFKDLTTLYDASVQGNFTYSAFANTWSTLAVMGGMSGEGFTWNGTDDVGFFITYQSSSHTGGWTGNCRRTDTIPERSYANGFQAAASTTCLDPAGLKMRLATRPLRSEIAIPDAAADTGVCNLVPFSTTYGDPVTYLSRIPASYLDPDLAVIADVGFAPCGTGTWTGNEVLIGIGHVNGNGALPCPFSFPNQSGPGGLRDFTVLWDSTFQGPLTWSATQDVWSFLRLAGGPCGTGFRWNGTDDIAFYISARQVTLGGSWTGSCHRSSTEPERTWDSSYLAQQSSLCNEAFGLKMKLVARAYELPQWQTNQPGSTLTVNGAQASGFGPIQSVLQVGQSANATFQSVNAGLGWDFCTTSPEAGLAADAGGIRLPDCQVINLNLLAPSLTFLFGLQFNVPFQAGGAPFTLNAPGVLSAQMINLDPSQALGVSLSALNRIKVCNSITTQVPGPAFDDDVVTVNLGLGGLCAQDIPFFGTLYTQMHVHANGRVSFGGANPDFSPTVAEAESGRPFVGFWTDLDASTSGDVTISKVSGGRIRVDYTNMTYPGPPATATFAIIFEPSTGIVVLEGLQGIQANTLSNPAAAGGNRQFMGISRGMGEAQDAGPFTFTPGGSGVAVNPSNMMYDFYTPAADPSGLCSSLLAGTSRIVFTPNPSGGYDWSAQ